MERAEAMAWVEDLARERSILSAPVDGLFVAELSRINPTCGDQVHLALHRGPTGSVSLRGSVKGCVLSTAATTVAVAALADQTVARAESMIANALDVRLRGRSGATLTGDLGTLARLDLVPLRRRCVALPWHVIDDLLKAAGQDR